MTTFNPQKLSVKLIPPATHAQPIEGRKYTLTHSDGTGELFLATGFVYHYEDINWQMRDEVLAEWKKDKYCHLSLFGKAYVDQGEFNAAEVKFRYNILKKEMDTALKGMLYGDRQFFSNYPLLMDTSIYIYYLSTYPQYRQFLYYGTPRDYLE
ncbi:staygreen family protein [Aquibacillus rhizosphaerae]|uniref:Staygreen family protein n=1 Tax=Aquibacillus rhizosphaerae TaxID=3051431 RepID=A0ABT7L0S8_9BACI|nr:staygreen family protein [Aquibacillus sp. LR5S19]MDL4839431.1 staygreen family protein [Aquibacillus sp. LR5S19]